jgi:hypothetical protein
LVFLQLWRLELLHSKLWHQAATRGRAVSRVLLIFRFVAPHLRHNLICANPLFGSPNAGAPAILPYVRFILGDLPQRFELTTGLQDREPRGLTDDEQHFLGDVDCALGVLQNIVDVVFLNGNFRFSIIFT